MVENAKIFFTSWFVNARVPPRSRLIAEQTKSNNIPKGVMRKENLKSKKTPDATIVAEWRRAEIVVGPSIASTNQK